MGYRSAISSPESAIRGLAARHTGTQLLANSSWQAECAAVCDGGDANLCGYKNLATAQDTLTKFRRRAADADHVCVDRDHVIHARGFQKSDLHRPHHKAEGGARFPRANRGLVDIEGAQELGAPALHEAQIGGVIDRPGEIGVFIIDSNDMTMGQQRSLLFREEPELRRGPCRLSEAEMAEGMAG